MEDRPLQHLGSLMLHNTYDRPDYQDPGTGRIDYGKVYNNGVRGVELDLVKSPDSWEWSVNHGGDFQPDRLLSGYLDDLRAWHTAQRPDHQPVIVYLDLKGTHKPEKQFPAMLDDYLKAALGDSRIWGPRDLLTWPGDLMQTLMARGWPSLGELRGALILVLSGNDGNAKQAYVTNQRQRLCFADLASFASGSTEGGDRVIVNGDWNLVHGSTLGPVTTWALSRRAILSRVFNANSKTALQRLAPRVNIVATDKPDLLGPAGWWRLQAHPGQP